MSIAFQEEGTGSQVLDSEAYDLKEVGTASKFMPDEEEEEDDDYYENVQLGSGRSYGQTNKEMQKKMAEQMSPMTKQFMAEKEGQIRQDFLFEWFQKFHNNHHLLKSLFRFEKNNCIYNERYIAQLLHLAIPSEFDSIILLNENVTCFDELSDIDIRQMWADSYEQFDNRNLNLQLLANLKRFFRDKGLDFTPILKNIFKSIQTKEKALDTEMWQESFWQLISMIFTGLYLDSNPNSENLFVKEFFEVEIKVDVLLLRMVLDIVTRCLRQVEISAEAIDNSQFLNQSKRFDRNSIIEDIDKVENEELGNSAIFNLSKEFDNSLGSHRALNSNRAGAYSFKIDLNQTNSSGNNKTLEEQYQEEDDEHFLKEDHTQWDVFRDAKKFERREQILHKRKRRKIDQEKQALRSDREHQLEVSGQRQLNSQIKRLQERVEQKDGIIKQKLEKEIELMKQLDKKDLTIGEKDKVIEQLNKGIYHMEVLQEKFMQKDIEIENLIGRLGEVATENEHFKDEIQQYDQKLNQKTKYIDELKERYKHLKNDHEELDLTNKKNIDRYERQINHLKEQMQQVIEKQRELGNEELAQDVQKVKNADISQFDLDQSMNSQVNNEFNAGQDPSNTLGQDMPDDIDVGNVHFTASFFNQQQIEMVNGKDSSAGSPNVRSFVQIERQRSAVGGSFLSNTRSYNDAPNIQVYDEHQGSFLGEDPRNMQDDGQNIDCVNVDMINHDVMQSNLNTSQVSVQQKFDDVEEAMVGNNSAGQSRDYFEDTQGVDPNSIETMDDNPDDMQRLMKLATQNGNDEIKIKFKDYQIENLDKDDTDAETGTKFYESDDEEKNYTKTNMKNNSREEQLKLIPSLASTVIEMSKMRESCLSGQSEFRTNREMGYQELEEKYNHYRKTASQYEKLYGEYLEKFVVAEKERVLLVHQNQRAHFLIQKTAWVQAKWDSADMELRKQYLIGGGISTGICCIIMLIWSLT